MNKTPAIILLALALCTGWSCNDSDSSTPNTDYFPPVYVNLVIDLTFAQYSSLSVQQGWVYEQGGNKGIIIYRTTSDVYMAFDRTCPVLPKEACSMVSVDSSSTKIMCGQYAPNWKPCCGSTFLVENGAPIAGPAKSPLRAYNVRKDGNRLYITN